MKVPVLGGTVFLGRHLVAGRTTLRSELDPKREKELFDTWNAAVISS